MKLLKAISILGLILITLTSIGLGQEVKRTAKVIELEGDVKVKTSESAEWVPAKVGMVLSEKDSIKTKKASWAVLNLDGTGETAAVEVKENSQLRLLELTKDEEAETQKTLLDLAIGKVLIKAQKLHTEESSFEVKTPTSIVGVRGTIFEVEVEALE